ncbi:MAG: nitroreductase family protein [Candidatus Riflebacteria bacterium]|nr:nitroreductase family protein [Candidatus Riflebacteria bacterium]
MTVGSDQGTQGCPPLGTYQEGMDWNPVENVIFHRRSIRSYRKDPLPPGVIRRILEAGRFAPSAGNSQPWLFVVITSPEIIAQMERDALRVVRTFMFLMDYTRSWFRRTFVVHFTKLMTRIFPRLLHPVPFAAMMQMARGEVPVFFEAPAMIVLLKDRRGAADPSLGVGIAGQNMVIAAHSLGVGTCWIGFVRLLCWSRNWFKWKRRLGIGYPYELAEAIVLGWPTERRHGQSPREVLEVPWLEHGADDAPRLERLGE